jgi:dTDP-4-amino-4,6-dideoxygalactose transaminase
MPAIGPPGWQHSWHLFVVRLAADTPVGRNEFIEKMAARNIGCSVHFIPLHIQPYWRDRYNLKPEDFLRAWKAYEGAVSLPLYPRMTAAEQQRVIDVIRSILQ